MTEKELSELYTRLALQFDSVLGTLVSKNLVFTDSVPGIRKDFYDSLNEEKRKDFERILTYTQIIRRYIGIAWVYDPKLDAQQKYIGVLTPVGGGGKPGF